VLQKLRSWPKAHLVSCVVLTDGERVLGLGDLGAGGLAISEGKILLYSCLAGVHPDACLPLCLDVGTNNQQLLDDPAYKGLRRRRLRGPTYEALLDEVVCALKALRHHLLLQWEDFGADNAFRLLARHRQSLCSFNDDIQGTAAVALAGAARRRGGRENSAWLCSCGAPLPAHSAHLGAACCRGGPSRRAPAVPGRWGGWHGHRGALVSLFGARTRSVVVGRRTAQLHVPGFAGAGVRFAPQAGTPQASLCT
jgi:hypothetical protein